MNPATRHSPVHAELARLKPQWGRISSMLVALAFGDGEKEAALREDLAICDLSAMSRFGLKGKNAAAWLAQRGVEVPEGANTWRELSGGGLAARLGRSELLVEDGPEGDRSAELKRSLGTGAEGVYPVLRQDAEFALSGRRVREVMSEVCGLDFGSVEYGERPVFFARVAVIPAMVLPRVVEGVPVFRLWCSYPYGRYLWEELHKIVEELGGGPIGLAAFFGGDLRGETPEGKESEDGAG